MTLVHAYNRSLELIGVIDDYESLIWTKRYNDVGDFVMVIPKDYQSNPLKARMVDKGLFLTIEGSDIVMRIDDKKPNTESDASNIIVSGESAESILKQRFTIELEDVDEYIETVVYDVLAANISAPTDPARHISIFKDTYPARVYSDQVEAQLAIDSVYNIITPILQTNYMGFKIVKEGQKLACRVFKGTDRSSAQEVHPVVMFSDNYDNVISSSFYTSVKGFVNVVQVIGDDEVHDQVSVWADGNDVDEEGTKPTGLDRFEGVLQEIVERDNDTPSLNDAQVLAIVDTKGREYLTDHKAVDVFDGDFDIQGPFEYGVDFFMGDIVECYMEGRYTTARVIEIVKSFSDDGITSYVTFDFVAEVDPDVVMG